MSRHSSRRASALDDIERRLARETELAQQERERMLRQVQRREWQRSFDAVKRRRLLRYLALVTVLILTAVLVTVVMFRILSIVFG